MTAKYKASGCVVSLIFNRTIFIQQLFKSVSENTKVSAINHFSTHIARIIICAKWGCGTVAGTTGVLAGAVTYDTILEATGREKIFVPFVARVFNDVFGEPMEPQNYQNLKPVLPSEDVDVEALQKSYDNLSPKEKEALYNLIVKERKES